MHSFLRAIGFSEYNTKAGIVELLNKVAENPDNQTALVSSEPETHVELTHYFGKNIGITWHGTIYEGEPDYDYYFPFYFGRHTYLREGFSIEKKASGNSYIGVIEDLRSGVSLIFYVINPLDYMEWNENGQINYKNTPVALSALSVSGTILLPISKNGRDLRREHKEQKERTKLLAAARNGDERAMESLTFQDMDVYTKISRRIAKEDIFSIVNSSLMPYGLECDRYSIVSDILEVEATINSVTGEKVWLMIIDYNGIVIDLAINDKDLTGEPEAGRRFKGSIWLQGRLDK
ncbi:MAG: DUF3881 family protein [Lachnospiraceae bacterium]